MSRSLTASTLLLAFLTLAVSGASSTSYTPEQPDVVGFVELDGVGRIDVVASPVDANVQSVLGATRSEEPAGAWIAGQNRLIVNAMAQPGDQTKGWVYVDIAFSTRIGNNLVDLQLGQGELVIRVQSHGVAYYEPSTARYPTRRHFLGEIQVEELARADDGTWAVRLTFDGQAARVGSTDSGAATQLGEVPMKGVLEVSGLTEVSPT